MAKKEHQHPRKYPDAVWRMRLGYEVWKRRTQTEDMGHTMRRAQQLRTPFRRLGVVRSVWLWARQEWRAKMERP